MAHDLEDVKDAREFAEYCQRCDGRVIEALSASFKEFCFFESGGKVWLRNEPDYLPPIEILKLT